MTTPDLHTLLKELHRELHTTTPLDETGRELLRVIDADIHALLEDSETASVPATLARLEQAIAHFEAEHPRLTAALSQVFATLSNAGI